MVRLLLFHQPPANALEACHHENLGLRCGCWIRKTSTIDPSVAQADLNINRDSATHHEDRYGIHSDEALEAADRCGAAGQAVNAIDWKLATTLPTTLAGIAAVLRFANEHEDAGGEWPGFCLRWLHELSSVHERQPDQPAAVAHSHLAQQSRTAMAQQQENDGNHWLPICQSLAKRRPLPQYEFDAFMCLGMAQGILFASTLH